jgi:hypothetical protein
VGVDSYEKGFIRGDIPSRAKMPAPSNAIPVILMGVCSVSMFLVLL